MRSREVSTRVSAHENTDRPTCCIFPTAAPARLTRVTLETSFFTVWNLGVPFVSHKNLVDSKRYGTNSFGKISRKSHGSVPKNSKQFSCSAAKTGWGRKLPPPHTHTHTLATKGLKCRLAMLKVGDADACTHVFVAYDD